MSFDWQTEEDNDWDGESWQEAEETAVSPIKPWRTLIIILFLLAVGGFILYQQISSRIDETTSAVETNIFATHNLLGRAAASQDGELGKAVLSGRDLGWSQTQTNLLIEGLFYQNPAFGLALNDPETAYAPLSREDDRFISLELDPELNGAEMQFGQDYIGYTKTGVERVTLQQTAVYRRGETRWLLAPPLEAYWGEWQTEDIGLLTVSFPARDEEISVRLAEDLTTLLEESCADLPDLNCAGTIQLRLDTNPDSLLAVADSANLYDGNLRFNLPAPSLIGLPINDVGYEALLNAYAAQLFAGIIAQSVSYECCQHAPMFQALMIYQLSELGLVEWPVTRQTHQDLAGMGVNAELLFPYWSGSEFTLLNEENSWQLFGFVDFLLNQYAPQLSALDLMDGMNQSRTYQSWLNGLLETTDRQPFGVIDSISRDWWFYAMTQAEVTAVSEQPISLPAQDLQVSCLTENGITGNPDSKIYRYQLGNDSWIEEKTYPGLAFFNPLPQDNGVILQLISTSGAPFWQTIWWENGIGTDFADAEDFYSISLGQMDPDGQFLLTYFGTNDDFINSTEEVVPEPLLIDIESCQNGSCATTQMTQIPHWSPNGEGMLLTTNQLFSESQYVVDGRILTLSLDAFDEASAISFRYLADAPETAVVVGEGIAPFWINDEQFGYIRTVTDSTQALSQELVYASVDDPTPVPLLTTDQLLEALPESSNRSFLEMRYAVAHPINPDLLVVMALQQAFDGNLFLLNRQTGEIELLFPLNNSRGEHALGFSPDGRFLVAISAIQPQTSGTAQQNPLFGALFLYDFETNNLQTILVNTDTFLPSFMFDWSRDGNWLAFTRDNGLLGLIAPAYNYQQTILHEFIDCNSLAWINP
ncbi:MAG: hypothetical protein DHS20C20_12880 [Ardenticatenaceae bacterium]|nr:MAG: hypothetical protein DHS20C20_12880 [Ardenticatenaceae bacterium]